MAQDRCMTFNESPEPEFNIDDKDSDLVTSLSMERLFTPKTLVCPVCSRWSKDGSGGD